MTNELGMGEGENEEISARQEHRPGQAARQAALWALERAWSWDSAGQLSVPDQLLTSCLTLGKLN